MCFLGAVFAFLMFNSIQFKYAMLFYGIYFTLSDGFVGLVLAMLSIAAPPDCKGQVMGFYITVVSMAGLIEPLTVNSMLEINGVGDH